MNLSILGHAVIINNLGKEFKGTKVDAEVLEDVTYRDQMTSGYANCYGVYSGFYSTSLLFGMGCVDRLGSLSGGAFNQLKLVNYKVLNIPLLT